MPNVNLLLAHRLRRWANNKSTLGQNVVFSEKLSKSCVLMSLLTADSWAKRVSESPEGLSGLSL